MQVEDPPIIKEAENHRMRVLDADHSKIDLPSFTKELKHLTSNERSELHNTLKKYPKLFTGGIGIIKGVQNIFD